MNMKKNKALNGSSQLFLSQYLERVEKTTIVNTKHPTLILASMDLNPPPLGAEMRLLSLAVVHILYLHAYPSLPSSGYAKFTIGFDLEKPDVTVTAGHAIRLYGDDGKLLPMSTVYGDIVSTLTKFTERYEESSIVRLTLRVYTVKNKVGVKIPLRRYNHYQRKSSVWTSQKMIRCLSVLMRSDIVSVATPPTI